VLRLRHIHPASDPTFAGGGSGNDVLFVAPNPGAPDPPPNITLSSWNMTGGEGNDVLLGGSAADALGGGSGDDLLVAADNQRDRVLCGDGFDVALVDQDELTVDGCEVVVRFPPTAAARLRSVYERTTSRKTVRSNGLRSHLAMLARIAG
jgi:Ca2+-binding RTX toxin-like protein